MNSGGCPEFLQSGKYTKTGYGFGIWSYTQVGKKARAGAFSNRRAVDLSQQLTAWWK